MELTESFQVIREAGFTGLELAPHTVFGDFSSDMAPGVAKIREALSESGLTFTGLHWLLVGPEDLHASSPDDAVWRRTWDHVGRLVDLAAELGGGVMVFGSPAQRASRGMMSKEDALKRFQDGLGLVADRARDGNCRILLEALAAAHTDIMNTLDEVAGVVGEMNHPAIEAVFDFHNVEDETLGWADLVRRHRDLYTHVHLNEPDGGPPTPGSSHLQEYRDAFAALDDVGYDRWVSLEIFSVPEDPDGVLRGVRRFLDQMR